MGQATDFKFGLCIHRVRQNKSPLKVLEKREHGHIQRLPKVLYSQLSHERVKLQTSNFTGTLLFTGSFRTKAHLQFWREGSMDTSFPKFFTYPILSQEWVKLRTSNLACTFTGPSEQPIKIFWRKRSVTACQYEYVYSIGIHWIIHTSVLV